jgi:hypothetical protein
VSALPKILPGTGRGTASRRWRGRSQSGAHITIVAPMHPTSPSGFASHLPVPGRIFKAAIIAVLAVSTTAALSGCDALEDKSIKACESFIKARLRSPSTYKRIDATAYGVVIKSEGKNLKTVTVDYDAANAYGTPIRGDQMCSFEVDKGGNYLDRDLEHTATMASIGADSEYAPCCLIDKKDRLSDDPMKASAEAKASANAALKAADEAETAAKAAIKTAEETLGDVK